MITREEFYTATLLRETGKLVYRMDQSNSAIDLIGNSYKDYSLQLARKFMSQGNLFSPNVEMLLSPSDETDSVSQPSNLAILRTLLNIAEACALGANNDSSTVSIDHRFAQLLSPFANIYPTDSLHSNADLSSIRYIPLHKLSRYKESLFPTDEKKVASTNNYNSLTNEFLISLTKVKNIDSLYALLLKYCVTVPAQTAYCSNETLCIDQLDVNLFDYIRSLSAIAFCLYEEFTEGSWKGNELVLHAGRHKSLPAPCLLVYADLSGIQDFIFDIPSKGAAKSLKARSYTIQLLTDVYIRYISDSLRLPSTSILYNGGGNFFLLVPTCREHLLEECREKINYALAESNLHLTIDWAAISTSDFCSDRGGFNTCWKKVQSKVSNRKRRKYQEIGLSAFQPYSYGINEDSYSDLKKSLQSAKGFCFVPTQGSDSNSEWQHLLYSLGYTLQFKNTADTTATVFNTTDFEGIWKDFRFFLKDTPQDNNESKDFDTLALQAKYRTGTDKLAVLKIDVDNLGFLLANGLPASKSTITRLSSVSRSLQWFFEFYMQTILEQEFQWVDPTGQVHEEVFSDNIYVVFSGGDDFFAVGAWDAILNFALSIQKEFSEFTANPVMTISGAVVVLDPTYPVVRFVDLVEKKLQEAKDTSINKNSINIFGNVLTWEEFSTAKRMQNQLVSMIQEYNEPRSIINKILRSIPDFTRIQEQAITGKIDISSVWRLAYTIRDVGKGQQRLPEEREYCSIIADTIVREYETMVFRALQSKSANPNLISVAARWAEFSTRSRTESIINPD